MLGDDCYSGSRFMLSIDQRIVNDNIPTSMRALELLFGSFFILNIQYPVGAIATLEFVQRYAVIVEKFNTTYVYVNSWSSIDSFDYHFLIH